MSQGGRDLFRSWEEMWGSAHHPRPRAVLVQEASSELSHDQFNAIA